MNDRIGRWRPWLEFVGLAFLLLAAIAVRLYKLHTTPPGLWLDEAANGLDVADILSGARPVFFPRNFGREPLFIYAQALSAYFFGINPYALRLTAAVIGALTVPSTYCMIREAFAGTKLSVRWLAFWTAFCLAFSYWHISLSRIGLRAIMLPLMATIAFAWYWRAWRHLKDGSIFPVFELVMCGVFVAGSIYTYTAGRFVPLLIVFVTLIGLLQSRHQTGQVVRIVKAMALAGSVTLLVFAPLGIYFLRHPDVFWGRAAEVSVLSYQFAEASPIRALARSAVQTAGMFGVTSDPNLRHNPAERPVFDPILGAWLLVGLGIAIARLRKLPYFFSAAWLFIFALPAVATAEGVPHSLRAVGMIPAACLLPVLGMMHAGEWLAEKTQWRGKKKPWLIVLFPLPFLLLSSATGLHDYLGAWRQPDRFGDAFLTEYVAVADSIAKIGDSEAIWLLPISKNYLLADSLTFYTLDLVALGRFRYGSVLVDPEVAPGRLHSLTEDSETAHVLDVLSGGATPNAGYIFGDPKQLINFLLSKYGRHLSDSQQEPTSTIAYKTYELPSESSFNITSGIDPQEVSFADTIMLAGVDFGRAALDRDEPDSALESRSIPSGERLWAVLRWQPMTPIDIDLKASLELRDESGHLAGQVDGLIVGDHYPIERIWQKGETADTYHILGIEPAIVPGRYGLYLKVYEDKTMRVYPVMGEAGVPQENSALLGYVDVTPARNSPTVSPAAILPSTTRQTPDLALLGYDLPSRDVRPGDTLPLTLYWQTQTRPMHDYWVDVEMRRVIGSDTDMSAKVLAAHDKQWLGSETYPTSVWREGEVVRQWIDAAVSPSAPSGAFELVVTVTDGQRVVYEQSLGEVEIRGRARVFEPPSLSHKSTASFDGVVSLLGLAQQDSTGAEIEIAPGQTFTVTLVWQAGVPSSEESIRFLHVVGSDGRPITQQDGSPCEGECPSSSWLPNEILVDTVTLTLPDDVAPGSYPLVAGWYQPATLKRLNLTGVDGHGSAGDFATLPVRLVVPPRD